MEQKIIQKIKNTYEEMYNIPYRDHHVMLQSLTRKILALFNDLMSATSDKKLRSSCFKAYSALSHTLDKEVNWADSAYIETLKNRAAKIRTKEYRAKLTNAINRIELDIFQILHYSVDEE